MCIRALRYSIQSAVCIRRHFLKKKYRTLIKLVNISKFQFFNLQDEELGKVWANGTGVPNEDSNLAQFPVSYMNLNIACRNKNLPRFEANAQVLGF